MEIRLGTDELAEENELVGFGSLVLSRPLTFAHPAGTVIRGYKTAKGVIKFEEEVTLSQSDEDSDRDAAGRSGSRGGGNGSDERGKFVPPNNGSVDLARQKKKLLESIQKWGESFKEKHGAFSLFLLHYD